MNWRLHPLLLSGGEGGGEEAISLLWNFYAIVALREEGRVGIRNPKQAGRARTVSVDRLPIEEIFRGFQHIGPVRWARDVQACAAVGPGAG